MSQRHSILAAALIAAIGSLTVAAEGPGADFSAGSSPVVGTLPEDFIPCLKPILQEAVSRAPQTISASIDLAQAEISRYAAAAPLWPGISGGASYAGSKESVSGGVGSSSKGLFYNAGIYQPIFQWGALKWGYDVGKLGEEVAKRQFGVVYRTLAVTIREQFLALIVKKIQARNRRYKLKLSQEDFDVAQSNYKAGLISSAEFTNYRLVLEDTRLVSDRAEEDYRYAKRVLMRLAGVDQLSDDDVPLEVPAPKYSAPLADALLQHFVSGGDASTFESQMYDLQIKEQDLAYRIARTRLLPKFSGTAGYSLSNQTTAVPGAPATANSQGTPSTVSQVALTSINYGITAGWTIFDGFATREAKRAALTAKRAYERQRQTNIDQSVDTATDLRAVLGLADRDTSLSEVRGDLVQAAYRKAEDDLKHGVISAAGLEVTTLTTYESEYIRASVRAAFFNHWCDYVSLTGMDPALENLPFHYVR